MNLSRLGFKVSILLSQSPSHIFSVDLRMAFVVAGDGLQWLGVARGVILGSESVVLFPVSF